MSIKLLPDLDTQKRIADATEEIASKLGGSYISITYADLVSLRGDGNLKKGAFYRIIDYETTTTQPETRSAGHLFDIIVQALDEKTLSENAQAIQSERDVNGYFDGVNLGAWKLKYTLENDRLKHYWADPVNGKGVIYRMIDEWMNDLPYDFKNIQFKRYMIETYAKNTDLENQYYALKDKWGNVTPSGATIDDAEFIWAYTFTVIDENGIVNDVSLNKNKTFVDGGNEIYHYTKNNKIGSFTDIYYDEIEGIEKEKETLGNSVMLYDYNYDGYWDFYGFNSNTIGNYFYSNTIGNSFYFNTIGNCFYFNTIGNSFNSNTIGNYFYFNTIGNSFKFNTIGNSFYSNTIGNSFNSNTIGNYFYSNTIGNSFYYNTIGNCFYFNTIGNCFKFNTIGNSFNFNTIGNSFYYNTIGNDSNSNTIGNYFNYNTIGNYNRYLKTEDKTYAQRIQFIHIENGVSGNSTSNQLDLTNTGTILTGNAQETPTIISKDSVGWLMLKRSGLTFTGKRKTTISESWGDL